MSPSTTMAYRDDQEALRARLEATEERLRVAEDELAAAKRGAAAARLAVPTAPPAPAADHVTTPAVPSGGERIADQLEHWVRGVVGAGLMVMTVVFLFSVQVFPPSMAFAVSVLFGLGGPGLLYLWLDNGAVRTAHAEGAPSLRKLRIFALTGAVGGWTVALGIVVLALFLRPGMTVLYDVGASLALGLVFGLGAALFFLVRGPPQRPWLDAGLEADPTKADAALRTRVAPLARIEVQAERVGEHEADAANDLDLAPPPPRRARAEDE